NEISERAIAIRKWNALDDRASRIYPVAPHDLGRRIWRHADRDRTEIEVRRTLTERNLHTVAGPGATRERPIAQGSCGDAKIPPGGLERWVEIGGCQIETPATLPFAALLCRDAAVEPWGIPVGIKP